MKKLVTASILALLLCVGVSAQIAKTVESVRKHYDDVAEKARLAEADEDRGQYGELVMNELVINKLGHPWRAVGIHSVVAKFFYTGGNTELHMYPDELVLVKIDREQFLYDKQGRLIFYYQHSENDKSVPTERRIYFSLGRAVRIVDDAESHDRLKPRDATAVRSVTAESAELVKLFNQSIKL
jgi:hypothetical protein